MRALKIDLFQLVVSSMFWVGVFAIVSTLVKGSFELLALFVGIVSLNLLLLFILSLIAPQIFKSVFANPFEKPEKRGADEAGNISFQLYPLSYPKVLDEELKDYAPEMIHVDIAKNNERIFSGNMARNTMRSLRDAIGGVLQIKNVPELIMQKVNQVAPAEKTGQSANPTAEIQKDASGLGAKTTRSKKAK